MVRVYFQDIRLSSPCHFPFDWASMKIEPQKSQSISICRGKTSDRKFVIEGEKFQTVREKPVKSLGRWYNVDLSDKDQVEQFRKDIGEGLGRMDKSGIPGKLKLWCLQFGLFHLLMWRPR